MFFSRPTWSVNLTHANLSSPLSLNNNSPQMMEEF
uniref:Uncharacterized protein n=1 Tax=Anguilla anguilla TaxID=7936 RepID=A0A0E9TP08_ANGAN